MMKIQVMVFWAHCVFSQMITNVSEEAAASTFGLKIDEKL
jgi:hypothetical protein